MHGKQLVELAGWVASHGRELIETATPLPEAGLQQYWVVSKCRLDRWKRALRAFGPPQSQEPSASEDFGTVSDSRKGTPQDAFSSSGCRKSQPVSRRLAMFEEIFLSEVLTRVWTALMEAYDRRRCLQEAGPIARSVFLDHLETRHRVLGLLVQPDEDLLSVVDRLNQLRSHTERWTDLLLGTLADVAETKELAFDRVRSQDFAGDFSPKVSSEVRKQAWHLAIGSMRRAFATGLEPTSANPDLNEAVAQAILACFPQEIRLHSLLDQSLWPLRITQYTSDLQEWVGSLLADEIAS